MWLRCSVKSPWWVAFCNPEGASLLKKKNRLPEKSKSPKTLKVLRAASVPSDLRESFQYCTHRFTHVCVTCCKDRPKKKSLIVFFGLSRRGLRWISSLKSHISRVRNITHQTTFSSYHTNAEIQPDVQHSKYVYTSKYIYVPSCLLPLSFKPSDSNCTSQFKYNHSPTSSAEDGPKPSLKKWQLTSVAFIWTWRKMVFPKVKHKDRLCSNEAAPGRIWRPNFSKWKTRVQTSSRSCKLKTVSCIKALDELFGH